MKALPHFNLDEIVFEKREKQYGAYILRKQYPKTLLLSLLVAALIFLGIIASVFLIGKYQDSFATNMQKELLPPPPIENNPPPPPLPPPLSEENTYPCLTLILEKDHKIRWWIGDLERDSIKTTDYSPEGLRQVMKNYINQKPWLPVCYDKIVPKDEFGAPIDRKNCWQPLFIIKPRYNAQYQDFISVLNEFLVLKIPPIYYIGKFTADDSLSICAKSK